LYTANRYWLGVSLKSNVPIPSETGNLNYSLKLIVARPDFEMPVKVNLVFSNLY